MCHKTVLLTPFWRAACYAKLRVLKFTFKHNEQFETTFIVAFNPVFYTKSYSRHDDGLDKHHACIVSKLRLKPATRETCTISGNYF